MLMKMNKINKNALKISLLAFLILRLFSSVVLLSGYFQSPVISPGNDHTIRQILNLENASMISKLFLAPWYRWDTGHYIEIADYGYGFDLGNSVWPPMYPFLIKLTSMVIKPSLLAALLVSNFFTIIAFVLLYLFTAQEFSESIAKKTIFFLAIFPTSFYLVAGYTESIFLTFSIATFIYLKKRQWLTAGLMGCVATLIRLQGIVLILPIFLELYLVYLRQKQYKSFFLHSFSLIYPPFVYVLFSGYVRFGLLTNWPWETLSKNWNQHFGYPWEGFLGNLTSLLGRPIDYDITHPLIKIFSIILTITAIYFLIRIRKDILLSLNAYSWATLFLILGKVDDQSIMISTIRYLLVLFPIFISQAVFIKNKNITRFVFILSTLSAILLLILFYWWVWVA